MPRSRFTNDITNNLTASLPENWSNPQQLVFLQPQFLQALQDSHCIGGQTGWQAAYLNALNHPLPCYIKYHSMGEYVFDHAIAHAYQNYQLNYYPKLICAIPFTPVALDKFGGKLNNQTAANELLKKLNSVCQSQALSSWHLNFISAEQAQLLANSGAHIRKSVQFEWHNQSYTDFNDFLQQMRARKRKNINKERAKAAASCDEIKILNGREIDQSTLLAFYQCYQSTYLKRGRQGYLTVSFFQQICQTMPDNVRLIGAFRQHKLIAAAFYFIDSYALYGRYWGALEEVDCLHFELCYYQGIELAINKQLSRFNPGTQGEHKIARGFTPEYNYSAHTLMKPEFNAALTDFCAQESALVDAYYQQCCQHLPFKDPEDLI